MMLGLFKTWMVKCITTLPVDVPIGSTPITLSAHVGYQTFGDQGDGADYDYY